VQDAPTDPKPGVEAFALNTTGGSVGAEIERVCADNELVITTWSPIHLRAKLQELYWKGGRSAESASGFFEDTLRYFYLPRFKTRDVLGQAIRAGAASRDFFGTAYGETAGKFEGFAFGSGNVVFDDTLLLIEPGAAQAYEDANRPAFAPAKQADAGSGFSEGVTNTPVQQGRVAPVPKPAEAKPKSFHGTVEVPTATAKMHLVQLADEIVSVLASDPNAEVRLTVEISAEFPEGASDNLKRAVAENARSLGLKSAEWE
jgi:hypothetical protein